MVVAQFDTGVSKLGVNDYEDNGSPSDKLNEENTGKISSTQIIDNFSSFSDATNNGISDNTGKLLSDGRNGFPVDSPYNIGAGGSNLPVSRDTVMAHGMKSQQFQQRSHALQNPTSGNIVTELEKSDGFARKFKEGTADDESINQLLKSFEVDDKSGNPNHLGKHGSFDFMNRSNEAMENEFSS